MTRLMIVCAILIFLGLGLPRLITAVYAQSRIFSNPTAIQPHLAAVVFGAGLDRNGEPSPVLRDRVAAAVSLYQAGKVEKILMSGDNRFIDYNEPGAMFNYAVELGMPPQDIVLDYAGRRTYDTCYRAKAIFKLDSVILVTQTYHLPRAIFTCNQIGLPSIGFSADLRVYNQRSSLIWNIREFPATFIALVDVWLRHPLPVLGNEEPIFPD